MERLRGLLLLACITCAAVAHAYEEHWLRIALDHQRQALHSRLLVDEAGRPYVRYLDLVLLGLPAPAQFAFRHDDEAFYDAGKLPGYRLHVDLEGGYLHLIRMGQRPPFFRQGVLLLDLQLNGEAPLGPVRVLDREGSLLLPVAALDELGIASAGLPVRDGHVPVETFAGDNYVYDVHGMTLWMRVPPEQRLTRHLSLPRSSALAQPGLLSASLDYELSYGVDEQDEAWDAALIGAGVARGHGHCHNRAVHARYDAEWRRLDSRCGYDWQASLLSLQVGDGVSRGDSIGQSVRYGGVRIGTDFSLMPGMGTQPDLLLLGTMRVPSTMELWVNQQLVHRGDVGAGPYVIDDIPVESGSGDIRLVIEDALGTRQEITQPYYADPGLLRRGLLDWSVDAGRLREGYGLPEDRYTDAVAVAGGRYGLYDWLTVNARAEYQQDALHGLGGGAVFRIARLGVLEAGLFGSEGVDGRRDLLREVAFSRRGYPLSLGLRHSVTGDDFRQLGYAAAGTAPARETQGSIGVSLPAGMSLSLGSFQREYHDSTQQLLHSAALGIPLPGIGRMYLTARFREEPDRDWYYDAGITIPLGRRTTASAGVTHQDGELAPRYSLQRSLSRGAGYGYRLSAAEMRDDRMFGEGHLQLQNDMARLTLSARGDDERSSADARLGGTLVATHGVVAATREPGSAALVELPMAGVGIEHDNQPVATTGRNGRALVSGLRPYEQNRLRLRVDDLPMQAAVGNGEVIVTPGRQQVVATPFDVRIEYHLTARLLDAAGNPLPAGSRVHVDDDVLPESLGQRGLLYLHGEGSWPASVRVHMPDGRRCVADLPAQAAGDSPLLNAGNITCREIR